MLNLRYFDDFLPLERQSERLWLAERDRLARTAGRPRSGQATPPAWHVLRLWLAILLLVSFHRP